MDFGFRRWRLTSNRVGHENSPINFLRQRAVPRFDFIRVDPLKPIHSLLFPLWLVNLEMVSAQLARHSPGSSQVSAGNFWEFNYGKGGRNQGWHDKVEILWRRIQTHCRFCEQGALLRASLGKFWEKFALFFGPRRIGRILGHDSYFEWWWTSWRFGTTLRTSCERPCICLGIFGPKSTSNGQFVDAGNCPVKERRPNEGGCQSFPKGRQFLTILRNLDGIAKLWGSNGGRSKSFSPLLEEMCWHIQKKIGG